MFKISKWIMLAVLMVFVSGTMLTASCLGTKEASSVTISPSEAYNPIRTQHTLVAVVKDKDGGLVSGATVEWILNRAPGAVGDIVSMDGGSPKKIDNTYGTVKTDKNGEAKLTITSAREGITDVTAYVPDIKDAAGTINCCRSVSKENLTN